MTTSFLIEWIARGSAALVAVAAILFLAQRHFSASLKSACWFWLVVGIAVLPFCFSQLPDWKILPSFASPDPAGPVLSSVSELAEFPMSAFSDAELDPAPFPPAANADKAVAWWHWVWLGGSVILFLRLAAGWISLRRRRKNFAKDSAPARRCDELCRELGWGKPIRLLKGGAIPMTWGFFRARISLPPEATEWPADRLDAVLRHELAHVKRRDPLKLAIVQVILAAGWVHPALWLAARQWRIERERAADDAVLTQGTRPASYAKLLLSLSSVVPRLRPGPAMALCGLISLSPGDSMAKRISCVLDPDRPRQPHSGWVKSGMALTLSLLLGIASTLAEVEKPIDEKEPAKKTMPTVVIDAGHGGHDGGTRSEFGSEKDLNLAVARQVNELLKEAGVRTVMTRDQDTFLSLAQRVGLANTFEPAILVSFHFNSSAEKKIEGVGCVIRNSDGEFQAASRHLGSLILEEMVDTLDPDPGNHGVKKMRFPLLEGADMPAVLVNGGYLTHPEEGARIITKEHQHRLAMAVVTGVLKHLTNREMPGKSDDPSMPEGKLKAADRPAPPTDQSKIPELADGFDFPVGAPDGEGYYITRGFETNGHLGDDFNGKGDGNSDLGDPVFSIGHGTVVFAEDVKKGWGNVVITRHDYVDKNGKRQTIDALYGHLGRIDVKKGDRVRRGQQVGTIGRGNHDMYLAHLHFEIRKNLDIMMNRKDFARDHSNYYSPKAFIRAHRP